MILGLAGIEDDELRIEGLARDVVRHSLVQKVVQAYDRFDREQGGGADARS